MQLLVIFFVATLCVADKSVSEHAKETIHKAAEVEMNAVDAVEKAGKEAVQHLNSTVHEAVQESSNAVHGMTNPGVVEEQSTDPCSPVQCNNRGTCIGTKGSFLCACAFGFSGKACEETMCESTRDCNGRGLCLGTTTALTCLCNLGYTGQRCETTVG